MAPNLGSPCSLPACSVSVPLGKLQHTDGLRGLRMALPSFPLSDPHKLGNRSHHLAPGQQDTSTHTYGSRGPRKVRPCGRKYSLHSRQVPYQEGTEPHIDESHGPHKEGLHLGMTHSRFRNSGSDPRGTSQHTDELRGQRRAYDSELSIRCSRSSHLELVQPDTLTHTYVPHGPHKVVQVNSICNHDLHRVPFLEDTLIHTCVFGDQHMACQRHM